jgi:hypothetical protein
VSYDAISVLSMNDWPVKSARIRSESDPLRSCATHQFIHQISSTSMKTAKEL